MSVGKKNSWILCRAHRLLPLLWIRAEKERRGEIDTSLAWQATSNENNTVARIHGWAHAQSAKKTNSDRSADLASDHPLPSSCSTLSFLNRVDETNDRSVSPVAARFAHLAPLFLSFSLSCHVAVLLCVAFASPFSVVVYVTGDVGGPTLVTTQRLTSKRLADRGWIVHPRVNRVCMFDGGVLHGVIPGRGIPQSPPLAPPGDAAAHEENGGIGGGNGVGGGGGDSEGGGVGPEGVGSDQSGVINPAGKEDARRDEAARGGDGRGNGGSTCKLNKLNKLNGVDGGGGSGGGGGGDDGANPKPIEEREGMRVTWMVAFWRDIQSRPPAPLPTAKTQREASSRPPSGAGAAQPFPQMPHPGGGKKTQASASAGRVAEPTWPALFRKKPVGWGCCVPTGGSGGPADGMVTPVTPVPVPRVWEDVDGAENRRVGGAVSRLKRLPEYDLCFQGF